MLLDLIQRGGFVMYPLLGLSFLSFAVITERLIFWTRIRFYRDHKLEIHMLELVEKGQYEDAIDAAVGTRDFIVCVLINGLRHRYYSLGLALETQAGIELKYMKKNMTVLDTIITAAPLLGILGTVVGIIMSFDVLGIQGVADPKIVTQGISQALITTAYGLCVSLFTIFPYNFFSSKCRYAADDMEKSASTLEMLFEKEQSNITFNTAKPSS